MRWAPSLLRVVEIFDSLQGEGVWAGTPMTFVRLAGCNSPDLGLDCVGWCDTPEAWNAMAGVPMRLDEVCAQVHFPRVCITGGEPLLQPDEVADLVERLRAKSVEVHLETNGTLPLAKGTPSLWLTVSPKPPDYLIHEDLAVKVDELKVIVRADFTPTQAETLAARYPRAVLCLQPEASSGAEAVRRAVSAVMEHSEWRLSLQIHKIIGLP